MDILKYYDFKRQCFQQLKERVEERTYLETDTRKKYIKVTLQLFETSS